MYKLKNIKKHFYFGKTKDKIAKIYILRKFSNVFITLTDLNDKVIICKTSGSSDNIQNKRRKRIAQAVEKIMIYIYKAIKYYKIKKVQLVLKIKIKSHVYTLLKRLKFYNIGIYGICSKKIIAHNGVRGKKLRRL